LLFSDELLIVQEFTYHIPAGFEQGPIAAALTGGNWCPGFGLDYRFIDHGTLGPGRCDGSSKEVRWYGAFLQRLTGYWRTNSLIFGRCIISHSRRRSWRRAGFGVGYNIAAGLSIVLVSKQQKSCSCLQFQGTVIGQGCVFHLGLPHWRRSRLLALVQHTILHG